MISLSGMRFEETYKYALQSRKQTRKIIVSKIRSKLFEGPKERTTIFVDLGSKLLSFGFDDNRGMDGRHYHVIRSESSLAEIKVLVKNIQLSSSWSEVISWRLDSVLHGGVETTVM